MPVEEGALFYGRQRERHVVSFTHDLRQRTEAVAQRFHALVRAGEVPMARYQAKRCRGCSLRELCQPHRPGDQGHGQRYLSDYIGEEAP
ncbi:hypothetical protein D3C86_1719340 [compost metagenome]